MLSEKLKKDVMKIDALFDFYDELSKRKIRNDDELEIVREKLFYTRKKIIEITSDIKKTVKDFENRL